MQDADDITAPADVVPTLPPNAPRMQPNAFWRWLGRSILRLGGWRMIGTFADIPKMMLIVAPHSSNWDGLWGFAAKMALEMDLRILGKDTLLRVPVLGRVLEHFGVIPVDRSAAHGVVRQAAALIRGSERIWFVVAPEGTRKPVTHWKTGFWKIAHAAEVPVLPVYFHYPDKVIGIGPVFELSDDMAADIARIRAWYRPWQGKYHGTE